MADVRNSINEQDVVERAHDARPRGRGFKRVRLAVQGIAALVQNANVAGFLTGSVYDGASKAVCVPGLNCHACPGALGACPLGALQTGLSAHTFKFPYYIVGLIVFFGAIFGRAICGFLCPFGFFQDLLHKIPFPRKIGSFKADKPLRKLKYVVLALLVVAVPLGVKLTPAFCKYVCPSGTLAGLLLMASDTSLFKLVDVLFSWKLAVLVAVILLAVAISRPFCKYLCPLGALYAPFNKVALVRMSIDGHACVGCGACAAVCKMGVNPARDPNSLECIRCGECIDACQSHALSYSMLTDASGKADRASCDGCKR